MRTGLDVAVRWLRLTEVIRYSDTQRLNIVGIGSLTLFGVLRAILGARLEPHHLPHSLARRTNSF